MKSLFLYADEEMSEREYVIQKNELEESDPRILKEFINSVTSNFCIDNGKIRSITFRNGIIHEFIYTDDET